jgi:hypothetical protein
MDNAHAHQHRCNQQIRNAEFPNKSEALFNFVIHEEGKIRSEPVTEQSEEPLFVGNITPRDHRHITSKMAPQVRARSLALTWDSREFRSSQKLSGRHLNSAIAGIPFTLRTSY